jgi:tellurite resistance protein TehA-like permease
MTALYELDLASLPVSICAISLGNAGVAVIWRNLGMKMLYTMPGINIFVYIESILALFLLSLYIARLFVTFEKFKEDFTSPPKIAALGAFTMSMSLLSSILSIPELRVHIYVSIALILLTASLQMIVLLSFCYHGIPI